VFLTINGKRHYLWRAVDQDDTVLDILVMKYHPNHTIEAIVGLLILAMIVAYIMQG
jgi:transposase-like protein